MADNITVCSMCGDVGFPDKLFQCTRCVFRFQHLYCSNYYEEQPSGSTGVCDWCLSEERSSARHGSASKKHASRDLAAGSGDKVKRSSSEQEEMTTAAARGKSSAGTSTSSKSAGRRYKLLKDVLC